MIVEVSEKTGQWKIEAYEKIVRLKGGIKHEHRKYNHDGCF